MASYCSQTLKKSKLEWHRAALFLYKYSYECLKAFEEEYISARKRNEIEQEELTILQEENELVKQQLVKVKTFVDKKVKLSPEEIKLVELTTN